MQRWQQTQHRKTKLEHRRSLPPSTHQNGTRVKDGF
jgi:hypothetical protein